MEFALVAPLLMLILAAVIDIGGAVYARLALDAQVTAAADYALLQPAPQDEQAADALAMGLAGLLQDTHLAEIVVNNAVGVEWNGSTLAAGPRAGDAASCYCPTDSDGGFAWGPATECGAPCPAGGRAGRFVQITASATHAAIFPGYDFMDGDMVETRAVVRLQ